MDDLFDGAADFVPRVHYPITELHVRLTELSVENAQAWALANWQDGVIAQFYGMFRQVEAVLNVPAKAKAKDVKSALAAARDVIADHLGKLDGMRWAV